MEAARFRLTLLVTLFLLLMAPGQNSDCAQKAAAAFHIIPSKLQLFEYESVSFTCLGFNVGFKVMNMKESIPCSDSSCTINFSLVTDSGEYWCEGGGERSRSVSITVTDGPVVLESPARPVMEGDDVTLSCRSKMASSNLTADFYKDGVLIRSSSTGNMSLHSVSKSEEGRYKCGAGAGESAESPLTVTGGGVILEAPAHPVTEGQDVTLSCRKEGTDLNLRADFYKNGCLMSSSSAEMIIHRVSSSDGGFYKCSISGAGESAESWLNVTAVAVILEAPVLPVTEGEAASLCCRLSSSPSNVPADFYKDDVFIGTSSTGNLSLLRVSATHEGLYRCHVSGAGRSAGRQLVVTETRFCSDHVFYYLHLVRAASTVVMVILLLLLLTL